MTEEEEFEKRLVENFSFELDFDFSKFKAFLIKSKMDLDVVEEQALYELGCGELVDNRFELNKAGVLFFSFNPQKFVSHAFITCVRYQGNSMVSIVDRKDLEGDLLVLVDEAEAFVKKHTRLASKFEGFKRIDIEEYPFEAIREAIINAVCHRNYLMENNVFVNIFDDRIEVISPGGIPHNLSLKEVEGKSIPRNHLITKLFKKTGYTEKLGSGIKRMNELMLFHGLKKPIYSVGKAYFQVTFFGPKEKIFDLVEPTKEIDLRELGLNERQVRALNYLQENKRISSIEYQKVLGTTEKTAQRDLNELIEKGFISKKGAGRSTYYSLV